LIYVPMLATNMKRYIFALLLCCAWMSVRAMADAAALPKQWIAIPAGDLVTSLEQLAKQSGIEFVYDADQLKGIKTHGVNGRLTSKEAVLKLLEGTDLTLTEHEGGAFLIAAPQDSGPHASNPEALDAETIGKSLKSAPLNARQQEATASSTLAANADQNEQRNWGLEEIVVTGTHIRSQVPVGSDLIIYTRADIEESGSGTLDQFARQMPENFSGADTIANINTNANIGSFRQGAVNNVFGGSGFNLNGLGPGSTLTLLNGHRLAPGAYDGSLVDISQIPLSAIDHIEVLDDGASAIYGSDAVAGVVNIITRRDFDGAESGLRYAASNEGGANEFTGAQLLGHSWGSGNALINYEHDDQGGLDASQRSWIGAQSGPVSLIPENRRNSVFVTGMQDIDSGTSLTADVLFSDRDFKSAAVLYAAGEIADQLSYGHATESAADVSLDRKLAGDWHASITGNFSSTRQLADTRTVAAPDSYFNGSTDEQLGANSAVRDIDALGSGSLFNFYGGAAKASLGGSYRAEQFKSYEFTGSAITGISLQRQVTSAYGEIFLPYVGDANAQPWTRRLEVSAAYRYDHYSDFNSTSNPKVGLLWEPVAGFQVRGTFGESFQAPLLSQLGSPITSETALIPDSLSPDGRADILEISGGNPNLLPQRSNSVTAGFDYKPPVVAGLVVSTTYFHVLFKNRIQAPNITSQAILSQPLLIPFLSGNPSVADVRSYFNSPGFQGDHAGLGPSGVVAIFDDQLANMATTVESGLSFSAKYNVPTNYGQFRLWLSGTHLLSDSIQTAALAPWFVVGNTVGEPTTWRVRGGLGWARNGFASSVSIDHVSAYQNTLFTPSQTISSWTTANFYVSYDTGSATTYLARKLKISLGVQNITDERPPYLRIPAADLLPGQNAIPFDGTNASPVGRLVSLQVTKDW
jgi:iron complex outermembrane recepter protein